MAGVATVIEFVVVLGVAVILVKWIQGSGLKEVTGPASSSEGGHANVFLSSSITIPVTPQYLIL